MATFKFIALFMCIGVVNTVDIFVKVRFRGSSVMTSYSNQETITAKNEQELREKLTETLERALLDKQIEEVTIETDIYHGNKVQSTQVTKFDVTTADGLDDTTLVTLVTTPDITKAVTSSAARSSSRTRKANDVTTSKVIENVFTTRSITSVASSHEESTMTAITDAPCPIPDGVKYDEYDGKLFIPLLDVRSNNRAEAELRCQKMCGQLANIYNNDHMDRIMKFIRSNLKLEKSKAFHLGMTYDPEKESVLFRNGTAVSQIHFRWGRGFPRKDDKQLYLRVNKNETSNNQYLRNWADVERFVLCER